MQPSDRVRQLIAAALSGLARRVFGMPFWILYVLVLGFCLFQNGFSLSPQTSGLFLVSADITRNPFIYRRADEWLLSSFLGPLLASVTSMNRSIEYFALMHLAIFFVFFTVLVVLIRRRNGDFAARCVLLIFMLSPLSNVLLTWIGSPDILTALLSMTIVVFWNNPIVLGLCAFLLGTNHPEQGGIILLLLTMLSALTRKARTTLRFAVVGLGSLALGIAAVQWYFDRHNFEIVFTRLDYLQVYGLFQYVRATLSNPFALVFSLYNVLVLFVAAYVAYFWKRERIALGFLIYSALAFIVILFTLDQTRVFAILTFPALLLLALSRPFSSLEGAERHFFEVVLVIALTVGILLPRFVVWNGSVYVSAYPSIFHALQATPVPRAG